MSVAWVGAGIAAVGAIGSYANGKKASKGMDAAAAAQFEAVESQERMANKQFEQQDAQFAYFKERQVGVDKVAEEVTRRELALAEETAGQGRDIFNYQKEVFRPVEQSLVSQAMRESTPEYYEKYVSEAMAKTARAQAGAVGQTERNMSSMGVNPNSGAWQSAQRGLTLQSAANMGAVANESRDRAESIGWARKAEVTGLGKGLVGAGNASYGLATGANATAAGVTNNANGQAISSLGTPTQYGSLGIQGMSNAMGGLRDIYGGYAAQLQSANAAMGSAMQGLGTWAAKYGTTKAGATGP